jgi:hypothetical protein
LVDNLAEEGLLSLADAQRVRDYLAGAS